jgi:hypothetical protein
LAEGLTIIGKKVNLSNTEATAKRFHTKAQALVIICECFFVALKSVTDKHLQTPYKAFAMPLITLSHQ